MAPMVRVVISWALLTQSLRASSAEKLTACPGRGAHDVVRGHDLTGQTHVVTGGTHGIGLALVDALVGAGAHVVIAAHGNTSGIQQAHQQNSRGLGSASFVLLDLASFSSIRRAAAQLNKLERIDSLTCNAGIADSIVPRKFTDDGFEYVFQVNFLGHVLLLQELMPALRRDRASVLEMSSLFALFVCNIEGTSIVSESGALAQYAYHDGPMPDQRCLNLEAISAAAIKYTAADDGPKAGSQRISSQYALTKYLQLFHVAELARREPRLKVYALHPGNIMGEESRMNSGSWFSEHLGCPGERRHLHDMRLETPDDRCPVSASEGANTAALILVGGVPDEANGQWLFSCRILRGRYTPTGDMPSPTYQSEVFDWAQGLLAGACEEPACGPSALETGSGRVAALLLVLLGAPAIVALLLVILLVGLILCFQPPLCQQMQRHTMLV